VALLIALRVCACSGLILAAWALDSCPSRCEDCEEGFLGGFGAVSGELSGFEGEERREVGCGGEEFGA
jgi:hypothetical protein